MFKNTKKTGSVAHLISIILRGQEKAIYLLKGTKKPNQLQQQQDMQGERYP